MVVLHPGLQQYKRPQTCRHHVRKLRDWNRDEYRDDIFQLAFLRPEH